MYLGHVPKSRSHFSSSLSIYIVWEMGKNCNQMPFHRFMFVSIFMQRDIRLWWNIPFSFIGRLVKHVWGSIERCQPQNFERKITKKAPCVAPSSNIFNNLPKNVHQRIFHPITQYIFSVDQLASRKFISPQLKYIHIYIYTLQVVSITSFAIDAV